MSPEQVPARRIPVLVGTLPIEDGQTPPPAVGEIGTFPLIFAEARHDEPDATVSTWRVRAEPGNDGKPCGPGRRWDGTPHDRPPYWPTTLHGDGWSANWPAPRPVTGQVELRGTLVGDLGISSRQWVRGRVLRARVVTETIDTSDPDQTRWRSIPARQSLREVEVSPRWFDHGLVAPPDAPTSGWYSPVPGDPYVVEAGVLIELDLDDVPPLPLRPAIVPGAVSASGPDLWVADSRLPLVVRLRGALTDHPELTEYRWDGPILAGHPGVDGQGERVLHADRQGCWIVGPDGVQRAELDDAITPVSSQPAGLSAANDTTLAVRVPADHQGHDPLLVRLHQPDGAMVDVALPDHALIGLVAYRDGFLLMLGRGEQIGDPQPSEEDRRPWLAALAPTGRLRHGPPLALRRGFDQLIPGDPPRIFDRGFGGSGRLRPVRDDLTADDGIDMPKTLLAACGAAGRSWVAVHPPHPDDVDRRGVAACWPLSAPPTCPDERQHWLLTELDPDTAAPIVSTLVPAVVRHIAVDQSGTAWILADGLRHLPAEDGAAAEPLDLARLLPGR